MYNLGQMQQIVVDWETILLDKKNLYSEGLAKSLFLVRWDALKLGSQEK